MIDLLFVALFQAAAGAPQATPATDPPAGQTTAAPGDASAQATPANSNASHDQGIRCQAETRTGSLMHHRVCTTAQQRHDRELQNEHDHDRVAHDSTTLTDAGLRASQSFGNQ